MSFALYNDKRIYVNNMFKKCIELVFDRYYMTVYIRYSEFI